MNKKKFFFAVIFLIVLLALAVPTYTYYSKYTLRKKFEETAPLPTWWDDVDTSNVKTSNYDELLSYWQSEKRCCSRKEIEYTNRQFFKTMYLSIIDHIDNPDIVMNGINLMSLSYLNYDHLYYLQMFALNTYPDYKKPLHACANCMTGDVIASILEDLYRSMASKNSNKEYIKIANEFLEKRGLEISDYYIARVYMTIAKAYQSDGNEPAAIGILTYIIDQYKNARKSGSLTSTLKSANIMLEKIRQER